MGVTAITVEKSIHQEHAEGNRDAAKTLKATVIGGMIKLARRFKAFCS